ncbi:MAG: hypothetical protein MR936_09365 [Eubacterium sp.]|nr:hypothetical protein [Eubacterium sp.]
MRYYFGKKHLCVIAVVLLLGTLTACESSQTDIPSQTEKEGSSNNPTGEHSGAEQDTALEEDKYSVVLEPTGVDRVVRIANLGMEGYSADQGWMKDGYFLISFHPIYDHAASEENSEGLAYMEESAQTIKLLLFSLESTSEPAMLEVSGYDNGYLLLNDGQVLEYQYGKEYRIYDEHFQLLYEYDQTAGALQGVTEEGELWFYTNDSRLVLHKDGKVLHEVKAEGTANGGTYVGESEGKALFCLTDSEFDPVNAFVNLSDWSFGAAKESTLQYSNVLDGYINYSSDDTWYLASVENPDEVIAFTKDYVNEYAFGIDEKHLLSNYLLYDSEEDHFTENAYVYDMTNGGLCAYISPSMYGEDYSFTFLACGEEMLLFQVSNEDRSVVELCLWDIEELHAETPAAFYEKQNYDFDQDRVDALIREIGEDYAVEIYYNEENLDEFIGTYDLVPAESIRDIGKTLLRLRQCLAEYPKGFFEDLKGEGYDRLIFYLCGAHVRNWEGTIENAAATGGQIGDSLVISYDVHSWSSMRTLLLHEMMHLMEARIIDETLYDRVSYQTYWEENLNVPEYPYLYSYIYEDEVESGDGVFGTDPDHAAFINAYSRTFPIEDRATILEYQVYSYNDDYFSSPILNRKAKFLTGIIRETFPSVKTSDEEVFWEHITGIVDLTEEFPDYVNAR